MIKELAQRVIRNRRVNDYVGKRNLKARLRNPITQFEVVGQIIQQRLKPSDRVQGFPTHRQSRAKSKVHTALNLSRGQHSRHKLRADADRFQP